MTTLDLIKAEMYKIVKTAKYKVTDKGVELDLPHDKLLALKSFQQDFERYENELRSQRIIDRSYKEKFGENMPR